MKKVLLGCVALSALTTGALAADLSAPLTPAPTWEGFHVGSYLGWAQFELGDAMATPSMDFDGGTAGLIVGYTLQSGNFVYGLEADIGFSNAHVGEEGEDILKSERAGVDWLGTVRGRVGYAFDNFLVYAAGGLAGADLEFDDSEAMSDDVMFGWTIGAGVEARLAERVSMRLEYLYSDYGDNEFTVDGDTYEASLNSHQVRLGLNASFDSFDLGGAPATGEWTGFYLGGHTGYAFANADVTNLDDTDEDGDIDIDGALRGLQAGYNWQSGSFVFGVEADLAISRARADMDDDAEELDELDLDRMSLNWLGTVRGRVGYSAGQFLLFATGGGAFAGFEAFDDQDSVDETYVGWTVGGGVEYQLTESTSLKLDYLYADLGEETHPDVDSESRDIDLDAHVVRVGANYRF